MAPRKIDYRERKEVVLGIVVDQYIRTINPVSSSYIVDEYHLDLSPATIRHILAELEEEGYLTHPHTSAGRVPTQVGYRYYVDHLMHQIQLLEEEKARIQAEYQKQMLELESLLEKTSELISNMTSYTSIISVDGRQDKIYCRGTSYVVSYPDFNNMEQICHILSALEEKERILRIINRSLENKIQIYIGKELEFSDIDNCSMVISSYKTAYGPTGRLAVLGPTRMNYGRVVSALDYLSDLLSKIG